MKKRFSILVVSVVIAGVALSLIGMTLASQAAPEPPKVRKIVVFDESFVHEPAQEALIKNFDGTVVKNLPLINGMAVLLPPKAEKALAKQAGVLRIDNDDIVFAIGKPTCINDGVCDANENWKSCPSDCSKPGNGEEEEPTPPPEGPAQTLPWGVDRIDADLAWATSTGSMVKVAIIDSGIDLDHPDLEVVKGVDCTKGPSCEKGGNGDDDYGHGTHVAGIAAALDNEIGVIGVAPAVSLYSVRVLNNRGIGFASNVIDGLNWSVKNEMEVANMSIGSSGCSESYHQAIIAAKEAGITIVAAAGNNGETDGSIVCPALWPETIAVSATNDEDGLAYFSSYGEQIDLAAPGEDINSTWNDGGYYVGSGTSMATPHVAGTAALIISSGKASTPDGIKSILETTAETIEMGSSCPVEDTTYCQGSGLVDAEAAVIQ